jgi:hypothetical protein
MTEALRRSFGKSRKAECVSKVIFGIEIEPADLSGKCCSKNKKGAVVSDWGLRPLNNFERYFKHPLKVSHGSTQNLFREHLH